MKFFILSILLFSNSILCSPKGFWTIQKKAPYELKVLIESFNMNYLTDEENEHLIKSIKTLDSLMDKLGNSDRYFIAKSTIYTWVLQNSPNVVVPKDYNVDEFKDIQNIKNLSVFSRWLLSAINSDLNAIKSSDLYEEFIKKNERDKKKITYKRLRNRIKLIKPWLFLFFKESPEQISLRLIKHQFDLLESIISHYKLFYRFKGKSLPQASDTMAIFKFQDLTIKKVKLSDEKILTKIDELMENHDKAKLPEPKNDWIIKKEDEWFPKDDIQYTKRMNLNLKNPNINPNYTPPKELPKPTNDWDLSD